MKATLTELEGCIILEPKLFEDKRGYFFESYNEAVFNEIVGNKVGFVQDNESLSFQGVLRGLHFQQGKYAQAKLVRVLEGQVLDVAVDIRRESPTFGQHIAVELSEENKRQLFIPRGFAHGFVVLSNTARFSYKCDNYYNKESEGGVLYSDKSLNIDWKLPDEQLIVSEKDLILPEFDKTLI
ncbi:dTDP-4-dehydrorhamnose 3,5-epimerase [Cognatitamlana onchidii]|uniref:dTDP-4-dehydrorhamnose 3,5-epimerase n=1 Tax=Cognatitamlana onchidii TaxID=2562860 RepID=UPI0010A5B52D|nr:dTDP-4-dehydrorhamnose 3,5-epimerase [Algibacter onchidii]